MTYCDKPGRSRNCTKIGLFADGRVTKGFTAWKMSNRKSQASIDFD